jgi:hypothetical protein
VVKLVITCLSTSAVALTALLIATAGQSSSFRGTTAEMLATYSEPARVLTADAKGAITQTGNGVVAGYLRGQNAPSWKVKFDRFPPEQTAQELTPDDAKAWCVGRCPAALVEIRGSYSQQSAGAERLAGTLTGLGPNYRLLDLIDRSRALVAPLAGTAAAGENLRLVSGSRIEQLPARGPSVAYADERGYRVAAGSAEGKVGTLSRMTRAGGRWRSVGAAVVEPNLQNICISSDGRWTGAISRRIQLMAFLGGSPVLAGNPVSGGICRADARGFTAVVNPADRSGRLAAARYTHDGRRLWARSLGSQRLISPTGSPLIVTETTHQPLTLAAFDAVDGSPRLRRPIQSRPYVGEDGSIVTADRSGLPVWISLQR